MSRTDNLELMARALSSVPRRVVPTGSPQPGTKGATLSPTDATSGAWASGHVHPSLGKAFAADGGNRSVPGVVYGVSCCSCRTKGHR